VISRFSIFSLDEKKRVMKISVLGALLFSMVLWKVRIIGKEFSGCQDTWENIRKTSTYEKLDRILASVEWE
jgi:hypothetical protein